MASSNSSRLDRSNLLSLTDKELDHFAAIANKAADAAGEIIRKYFGKKLKIVEKDGEGPVTIADIEAEEAIVSIILKNFPSHVAFGEESKWNSFINGKVEKSSSPHAAVPDFVWFVDPIDGTTSFIAGIQARTFGTLIALLYKGKPILGCIDQPISRDRWMGITGRRTTENGERVSASACEELGCAYANLKAPHYNDDAEHVFDRIVYKVGQAFFDGNCIACGELASGVLHVVVDCALDPVDFLALIPVVEGAGGVITDWQGRGLCLEGSAADYLSTVPKGGFKFVAAGDKKIHQQVIDELSADDAHQPMSRVVPITSSHITPYRVVVILWLIILGFFLQYRCTHIVKDAYPLWLTSVICEVWFALSWLLDQFPSTMKLS